MIASRCRGVMTTSGQVLQERYVTLDCCNDKPHFHPAGVSSCADVQLNARALGIACKKRTQSVWLLYYLAYNSLGDRSGL